MAESTELLCDKITTLKLDDDFIDDNKIVWCNNPKELPSELMDKDKLTSYIMVDTKKENIEGETTFCDVQCLEKLLETEKLLTAMSDEKLEHLRRTTNPYEGLSHKSQFVSRPALKLANLNAICHNLFIDPQLSNGRPVIENNDLMHVVDFGGGPGGFVDFLLSKKGWQANVFGYTPINDSRYKAHCFASETNSFHIFNDPLRQCNLTNSESIRNFSKWIFQKTQNSGAHIVFADAAINLKLARHSKEIQSKRLYLCCCWLALSVLQTNGIFVVKLFDIFTLYSVGLIYLMRHCFDQIALVKPIATRPYSSERYLICKHKRPNTNTIQEHFMNLNKVFDDLDGNEITELIPLSLIQKDRTFCQYIKNFNKNITRRRINAMEKMLMSIDYAEVDSRQAKFRFDILPKWNINECMPKYPLDIDVEKLCLDILKGKDINTIIGNNILTEKSKFKQVFPNPLNWFFIPIASETMENCTWFLSKGSFETFMYNQKEKKWNNISNLGISLPSKSLIYGEIVTEYQNSQSGKKQNAFFIIDAFHLGNVNVQTISFLKRSSMCYRFAIAINDLNRKFKNKNGQFTRCPRIASKMKYNVSELSNFVAKLNQNKWCIDQKQCFMHTFDQKYYQINGFMFFNEIRLNTDIICRRQLWLWNDPVSNLTPNRSSNSTDLNISKFFDYFKKPSPHSNGN